MKISEIQVRKGVLTIYGQPRDAQFITKDDYMYTCIMCHNPSRPSRVTVFNKLQGTVNVFNELCFKYLNTLFK